MQGRPKKSEIIAFPSNGEMINVWEPKQINPETQAIQRSSLFIII